MELSSIIRAHSSALTYGIRRAFGPCRRESGQLRPPHRRDRPSGQQLGARTRFGNLNGPPCQDSSPEALTISLEEAEFSWREILGGVSLNADTAAARRAMTRLELRYHPDKGSRP